MKVLVAYASKYGSTEEIALFIAKVLGVHGLDAVAEQASEVESVSQYDAVIVGSAVYAGNWLKPTREFVEKYSDELLAVPVWLFSSGPIGRVANAEKAVKINELVAKTNPHGHALFGGKVDKSQLNFAQKAILYAVRAGEGDYRNWEDIEDWATGISVALVGSRELHKEAA